MGILGGKLISDAIKGGAEGIINGVGNALDGLFTSDEERMAAHTKIKTIVTKQLEIVQGGVSELVKAQSDIIIAEANGESWLQRNWRPMLMCLFGVIIANNYILFPYLSLFFTDAPVLEIPPDMWALLKIGLGGYVVGRSCEKLAGQRWNDKEK